MEKNDGNEAVPEIPNPVVFQCHKCAQILGDSMSFVCPVASLDAVVLSSTFVFGS